jgi:hypothetical protein
LRHDPKTSVAIDYNSITDGASFLVINTYFEASESFNIDWNLNKKSLNIKEGAQSLTFKYTSICTHISIFSHHCYLLIDDYSNKDIGEYTAVITLKENPDVNISLNALVIKPSKYYCFSIQIGLQYFLIKLVFKIIRITRYFSNTAQILFTKLDLRNR